MPARQHPESSLVARPREIAQQLIIGSPFVHVSTLKLPPPAKIRNRNVQVIERALKHIETWDLKEVELASAFDDPQAVTLVPLEKAALRYAA